MPAFLHPAQVPAAALQSGGRAALKICDLTQFYSPVSGGVKRYVAEKLRYIRENTPADEHLLIIPGEHDELIRADRSKIYTISSPLISRTSRYRALLRLSAIQEILKRERPDIIESGDPYQVAWKAVRCGQALGIPVVGFYHSHFPEAYLRSARKFLGAKATELVMEFSRHYVRNLYNRFERTIVPSPALGELLTGWGLNNVIHNDLGVDTAVFNPTADPGENTRAELGIAPDCQLLLYVGRLAQEKNTRTLFNAFRLLAREQPRKFHLLVIGDGLQRGELNRLRAEFSQGGNASVSWVSYCADARQLARYYRAADLFVHPGIQETFGLVTLEAQACGTPVIGIRGSYMDRIIHSDQTLWARENSPRALATAIAETAAQALKTDPARLHNRVAAQYSWREVFHRLFSLYEEVIAARKL